MGIVASTLATIALRFAWNCQWLFDPGYRCVEAKTTPKDSESSAVQSATPVEAAKTLLATSNRSPIANDSSHHEKRTRRAAQYKYKTRPSSFDAALIRSRNSPSPLTRQTWEETSSSGCSSDSGSQSDTDSETELRVSGTFGERFGLKDEMNNELDITAAEEEAFRLTVGRGHFTRSKKDRFLNHLRLEKRMNEFNQGVHCRPQRHTLPRYQTSNFDRLI